MKKDNQNAKKALYRQLRRLAIERRPAACLGCGFANQCSVRGCAVLLRVSRLAAAADGSAHEKEGL